MELDHQPLIDQVRLDASGLHVSRLALRMMSYGSDPDRAWALDEAAAEPIVRRAVEAGFTFFDTADMYSHAESEVLTGRLLRNLISREEAVVATKVFFPSTPGPNGGGLSRKNILAAIDASLARLQMDYVDLYQIHRCDPDTPIEETMQARHPEWLDPFRLDAGPLQPRLPRGGARDDPQCVDQGVAVIPYSPLAQGFLAGTRPRHGDRQTPRAREAESREEIYGIPSDFEILDRVIEISRDRGVAPAQIALAWQLHKHGVTAPIIAPPSPSTSTRQSPPPGSHSHQARSNSSSCPTNLAARCPSGRARADPNCAESRSLTLTLGQPR